MMKLIRLEREGIVKLTDNPLTIERLKSIGYIEDCEVVIDEPTSEETEIEVEVVDEPQVDQADSSPFEKMTNAELTDFIISRGASVPNGATKTVLIDIAKTLEG